MLILEYYLMIKNSFLFILHEELFSFATGILFYNSTLLLKLNLYLLVL